MCVICKWMIVWAVYGDFVANWRHWRSSIWVKLLECFTFYNVNGNARISQMIYTYRHTCEYMPKVQVCMYIHIFLYLIFWFLPTFVFSGIKANQLRCYCTKINTRTCLHTYMYVMCIKIYLTHAYDFFLLYFLDRKEIRRKSENSLNDQNLFTLPHRHSALHILIFFLFSLFIISSTWCAYYVPWIDDNSNDTKFAA